MDLYLPGLGEGVDFHGERTPPQLVDRKNQRILELTALEAELVLLYAGERDPRQLADRAKAQGVAAEPSLVAAFLSRLAQAGFIPKPEVEHLLPPVRSPLHLQDPLPPFRADLKIRPSPTHRGLVEVVDEEKHRSFTIYDFEASVARLLDGHRTADEIIESGATIGIPISLASLESFLRQMAAYGFLGTAVPAGSQREPARQSWPPEIRALYQGALRLSRAGKTQEALDYLEALFETDPQNAEALALQHRLAGDPSISVDLNFDDLHEQPSREPPAVEAAPPPAVEAAPPPPAEPAPPAVESPPPAAEVPAPAKPPEVAPESFLRTRMPDFPPAPEAAPSPVPAAAPDLGGAADSSRAPERPRLPPPDEEVKVEVVAIWRRLWFQLLAVAVLASAVAALWPSRFTVAVDCQLEPVIVGSVVVPREGDIGTRLVEAGELAHAGQPMVRYQTQDLERELAKAAERATAADVEIARVQQQIDAGAVAKLTHQLEVRSAAVEKAAARVSKWKDAKPSAHRDQKLEAATHHQEVATSRVAETEAKLRAARAEDQLAALRAEISKSGVEQKRLHGEIEGAVILAPASGVFLPGPDPGDGHLRAGQDYGRIVTPDVFHLTATPPALAASADLAHAVLVMPPGRTGTLHDLTWGTGPDGPQLQGTVEGAAPGQGPVVGAVIQLDLGLRTKIWRTFHEK